MGFRENSEPKDMIGSDEQGLEPQFWNCDLSKFLTFLSFFLKMGVVGVSSGKLE